MWLLALELWRWAGDQCIIINCLLHIYTGNKSHYFWTPQWGKLDSWFSARFWRVSNCFGIERLPQMVVWNVQAESGLLLFFLFYPLSVYCSLNVHLFFWWTRPVIEVICDFAGRNAALPLSLRCVRMKKTSSQRHAKRDTYEFTRSPSRRGLVSLLFLVFNLQQYEGISKDVQSAAFQPTGNYPATCNWQQSRKGGKKKKYCGERKEKNEINIGGWVSQPVQTGFESSRKMPSLSKQR